LLELLLRTWEELIARVSGPFSFRIVMQPTVALILAIRAGVADARSGNPPYLWALFVDHVRRHDLIRTGWKHMRQVFILAFVLDVIYQLVVLRWIHPLQALIVATVLAVVPYLCFRGLVARVVRRAGWMTRT
jgi:hypothetical protein